MNVSDQFIELSIEKNKFTADLSWQNNTGDINAFFLVERAIDGGPFKAIAQVQQDDHTQKIVSYDYLDAEPLTGKSSYRVRAITTTGDNLFSNVVDAAFEARTEIALYPNPTTDYVMIDLLPYKGQSVRIAITNELGQIVKSIYLPEAKAEPKHIGLATLTNGHYRVAIDAGQGRLVSKSLIVSKM